MNKKGWAQGRTKRAFKRWARNQKRKLKAELKNSFKTSTQNTRTRVSKVIDSADNWWDRKHQNKLDRKQDRSDHIDRRVGSGQSDSPWLAKHPWLAEVRDWFAMKGHAIVDRRELRGGVITQAELDEFENFSGPEEWKEEMLRRRAADRQKQRVRNRDVDYGPLVMVYGGNQATTLPKVKHAGFRPPPSRPSPVLKPVKGPEPWKAPKQRPVRKRRKNHVERTATAWGPKIVKIGTEAMATNELSKAVSSMMSFAETFPETRTQVHEKMAVLGEFGKANGEFYEHLVATLRAGVNEDNPGLPPEVLQHIEKLTEIGAQIEKAAHETLAAWEDYFANAIKAAQDEYTPNKQALNS